MIKAPFPWIALGVGLLLLLLLLGTGALPSLREGRDLPLLTQLIMAEFGFFLTAIGAYRSVVQARAAGWRPALVLVLAGCVLLAVAFLWLGVQLWPGAGLD